MLCYVNCPKIIFILTVTTDPNLIHTSASLGMLCCPTILDQAEGTRRPIHKAEEMPMSQSDTGWFCRKSCFCIV